MEKEKFGNFIKDSRQKKEYTQKQLADKLFIDVTAVSKWERGITYPDITLVPEICKVLDINEHELIQSSYDTEYRKNVEEAEKYQKIKNAIFYTTSILYLIAVFVCFIVNLAVNHSLTWFWIVLASCLTAFTFIPTCTRFFKKYKFLAFILTTFTSLFLLFLTCSIFTKNYWFLVASSGTLLGYFALFFPILFNKLKMYTLDKEFNKIKKYFMLSYSLGLCLLTILLLLFVNSYAGISSLSKAIIITCTSYGILFTYSFVEFLNINRLIKLSIDFLLTGVELIGLGYVIMKLVGGNSATDYSINFLDWKNHINGNVACISFLSIILVSIILLIIGLIKKNKKNG